MISLSPRMIALLGAACTCAVANGPVNPTLPEIIKRLEDADAARRQSFAGYVGTRRYTVENARFHVKATMKVEVTVDASGRKVFRIVESDAPGAIRKMVFQRMLDTEAKASAPAEQATTRISLENYAFEFAGTATEDDRSCFVLNASPKTPNPLLFRGRIWVDSTDYAVVRIEGSPAQNPSFWVRKTEFEHRYRRYGQLWLALSNISKSEVRVFGDTLVRIEYLEYRLSEPSAVSSGSQ